ncbi:MOSC domain-containing protein [Glaciecola sp. 1036]|uniref:MOSC domain-containing protein n=1 Tax=Alteromonadaceae TaxID=72275 RepID=UPI003D04F6E8
MQVTHLFAGKPQPFGPKGSPSSIIKQAYQQLHVEKEGAVEDEQGNKQLHGGPEMAFHQYSTLGYEILQSAFPEHASKMQIGTIGENISIPDMHEENVFIGDVYTMGSLVLQVSSPRAPCAKINHRYDVKKVDSFILEQGNTGWYFRVLEPGTVAIGDTVNLSHREQQTCSVKDIMFMTKPPKGVEYSVQDIQKAATLSSLAPEWQGKLNRILKKL